MHGMSRKQRSHSQQGHMKTNADGVFTTFVIYCRHISVSVSAVCERNWTAPCTSLFAFDGVFVALLYKWTLKSFGYNDTELPWIQSKLLPPFYL